MDEALTWVGASPVEFSLKTRCCGGMLMSTSEGVALGLVHTLLSHAAACGAQMIVTACPLCQINLEAYQNKVNAAFGTGHKMPVAYFSQVIGIALGLTPRQLDLGRELVPTAQVFDQYVRA
jgi:heterodisulfide reductase subunit B